MQTTAARQRLDQFRQAVYRHTLGYRKDSLFDLTDAILTSPGPANLARLSLAPGFRRRWASVSDALADGTLHEPALRALLAVALPPPQAGERPLWVVDASTWPRPAAVTSPERTYAHRVAAGIPQAGIVAAWEYQWLVAVPASQGSWLLPLDVSRRTPTRGTPTELAIRQIRTALRLCTTAAPRPVVALDSGYDPVALGRAALEAEMIVRLVTNRVLFRAPPPYAGRGRPRRHGAPFRLRDAATWGAPDRQATLHDPDYGRVHVAAWQQVHAKAGADAPFTVIRVQVDRLPRRTKPPAALWLAWIGGPLPADLHQVWRWYLRRFTVEHGFRFGKQSLGWTTVRPRDPAAADRWSWLIALVFWQLWLARPLVVEQRLPWDRPVPADRLTPGRVRRAFPSLLPQVGTPACAPHPRGNAPGRHPGDQPGPRTRSPVVRRQPRTARRRRQRAA